MTDLDLLYTQVEEDLRASVRDLLADRLDSARVTAMYDGDRSVVAGLWHAIAVELGLAGLLVPENRGGAGGSAREAAVVLEELGRAVAPVPFLTSAVIATTALLAAESPAGAGLLTEVAGGRRTAALTVPWSTAPEAVTGSVELVDGRLSGTVTSVAGALEADLLLVPVRTPAGLELYAVDAAAVVIRPVVCIDMSRQLADLTLSGVEGTPLLTDAGPAIAGALQAGAALLASEQLGLSRWCLSTTLGYLKDRRQFGRVLGGFQALKHRLADLYADVESTTAAARYAAAALAAGDPDLPVATAVAAAFCGDIAVHIAEEALQLHGGIGMTWEYPVHLYLKRAKADQLGLGTAGHHRGRLAGLVALTG